MSGLSVGKSRISVFCVYGGRLCLQRRGAMGKRSLWPMAACHAPRWLMATCHTARWLLAWPLTAWPPWLLAAHHTPGHLDSRRRGCPVTERSVRPSQ